MKYSALLSTTGLLVLLVLSRLHGGAPANDYVQLSGPRLWLEYSAQPRLRRHGASALRLVWRDRARDYGGN